MSPPADTAVPVEYGRLTNLEILDFRDGDLATIRNNTLDAVRALNVSTVSFRDMDTKRQMLTVGTVADKLISTIGICLGATKARQICSTFLHTECFQNRDSNVIWWINRIRAQCFHYICIVSTFYTVVPSFNVIQVH